MAATVITIAQQKGGAGKTTLVAHLAAAWARGRKSVAVVDIDPQGSLARWYAERQATLGAEGAGITFRAVTGWRAANEVTRLARDHDLVLIDSPPHAETDARVAIRAAGLVVVPVQPTPLDLWATHPTLELAAKEKRPVVLVLNRVPPRAALTAMMITRLGDYRVSVAKAALGNRVAFADSMTSGLTAVETKPRSRAAEEMRALAKDLLKRAT